MTLSVRRFALRAVVTLSVVTTVVGVGAVSRQVPAAAATPVSTQLITVSATNMSTTYATLELWNRTALGGYTHLYSVTARIGWRGGIGKASEGYGRTPAGTFTMTQAFGNKANNGTKMPYFRAGPDDWWDENPADATYNKHVVSVRSPGGDSENLYTVGAAYAHAVMINYNTSPVVKGAGSAIFLHVGTGGDTGGCVSVPSASLDYIMRWLNPAAHPKIEMGIGAAGTSIVTAGNAHVAALAKHNPIGQLDSVHRTAPNTIRVTGWTADTDTWKTAIHADVYVDGKAAKRLTANGTRTDVQRTLGIGSQHGYTATLTLPAGRHTVCVYGINVGEGTGNSKLGCHTVSV